MSLDKVKLLEIIEQESIDVHGQILSAGGDETATFSSWVLKLASWWWHKKRKYHDYLSKMMTLVHGAYITKSHVSTYYKLNHEGKLVPVHVEYSPYDFVEMMTLYSTLKDPEGRRKILDATVEEVKNMKITVNGKTMTVFEYVTSKEGLNTSWETFEKNLRAELEATMKTYIYEIDNVKGSPLARHIDLRNEWLASGDIRYAWLMQFSQLYTISIASLHAKKSVAGALELERKVRKGLKAIRDKLAESPKLKDKLPEISEIPDSASYYKLVLRYKTITKTLVDTELQLVKELSVKHKYKVWKGEIGVEEAKKIFNDIASRARREMKVVTAELIPASVKPTLPASVANEEKLARIAKSRLSKITEENLNLNVG